MRTDGIPEAQRAQLSQVIADTIGLYFPRERWPDLQRGLEEAARESGDLSPKACADRLLSAPLTPAQLEVLAGHLTIGETYFFREKKTFEALAQRVLPALIAARRGRDQRLRIWSAGCCTGEEAYSLAIMVHQLLPDLADWRVTILATDLNPRFLRKALAGTYGEWSFRDAPKGYRERYFTSGTGAGDRYTVVPAIREMVTFAQLNLVADGYPSPATDTHAMDLIFCRNVLMYFTPTQTRNVIGKLHHALVDGGWLAVSPTEASQALFTQFVALSSPDTILYRKEAAGFPREQAPPPAPSQLAPLASPPPPENIPLFFEPANAPRWLRPTEEPASLFESGFESGRRAENTDTTRATAATTAAIAITDSLRTVPADRASEAQTFPVLAQTAANQGRLAEALAWCDRWIATDKLDSAGHYLRAVILLEQGDAPQARGSLQRAVYLEPDFVLAHFALGNLARGGGKSAEAEKHLGNALRLLARYQPNDPLPASDGLTAGRLVETIATLSPRKSSR